MRKEVLALKTPQRIVLVDSITQVSGDDVGSIVITASHGGASSAEYALKTPLLMEVFNDAGVGKDEAGIAALSILEHHGLAAATVSHNSARIGDSRDAWEHGIISRANKWALRRGLQVENLLRESILRPRVSQTP